MYARALGGSTWKRACPDRHRCGSLDYQDFHLSESVTKIGNKIWILFATLILYNFWNWVNSVFALQYYWWLSSPVPKHSLQIASLPAWSLGKGGERVFLESLSQWHQSKSRVQVWPSQGYQGLSWWQCSLSNIDVLIEIFLDHKMS